MSHFRNLLVIRLGALGDLIHVSPSLIAVKNAYPNTRIHLLTSPGYRALAGMIPAIDKIWDYNKNQGVFGLIRLAKTLRQEGIDGVINLHPSFKTWLLTVLLGRIPRSVYHKEKLRAKGEAQRAIPRRHAIQDFYEPFRHLLSLPSPQPQEFYPVLHMPESGSASASPTCKTRKIALIPGVGGKRGNRAWEADSYQELITHLLGSFPESRVLLIGGRDEQPLAESLRQRLASERLENHCGMHDIPGTAALLAQCNLAIGGDTGPTHLAAALGIPIIGIYGPTSLQRTGPTGAQAIHGLTPPEKLTCWPCEAPICPLSGESYMACMREISPTQVLESCAALLPVKAETTKEAT